MYTERNINLEEKKKNMDYSSKLSERYKYAI